MAKYTVAKNLIEKADDVKNTLKEERRRVVNSVKSSVKKNSKSGNSKVNSGKIELLITVVNRQKTEFYQDLLQSFEVNMQMSVRARGTATAQTLHLLGLEDTPKSVIFSFIREEKLQDALATLEHKFKTIKNGAGVAYTVPLNRRCDLRIFE